MTSLDQFKATYFQECEELLAALEQHLRDLKADPKSRETLDAAFRAVHSIKGGAAMFSFERVVAVSHAIESVLDHARAGRPAPSRRMADKLLLATDVLSDLADAARTERDIPQAHERAALAALEALTVVARRNRRAQSTPAGVRPAVRKPTVAAEAPAAAAAAASIYRIRFEPAQDLLRRGFEPLALVRSLRALGSLEVFADASALPNFAVLDPALLHLRWTFYLTTTQPRAKVTEVFDFVAGLAAIHIESVPSPLVAANAQASIRPRGEAPDRRPSLDRRVGSIRVELQRVERLADLVGEITIAQAMVLQHLDQSLVSQNPLLFRALTDLLKLSRTLQDNVMAIRAQPIDTIFARMHRIARDSALQLGREVELRTRGESTELDKTTVEQLADPLMHIVRNAIYHGIEPPDVRIAAGKPAQGTISLSAQQRGSRIIVQVSDDGAGIDRKAVLQRAVAIGIVGEDAQLEDVEIDQLIFSPGLSTATTISDIAGRGVGLDVVYQNIRRLGGHIAIRSIPGAGTTTIITLPMTLAVLDAMRITSAGETYLVPIHHIVECLVVPRSHVRDVPGACQVINVRGEQIRVIDLADHLGLTVDARLARAAIVICEIDDGSRAGLLVDEVIGYQQIVVKSLRDASLSGACFAGGTILGDGNVALILDVNQLAATSSVAAARTPRSMRIDVNPESCAA